MQCCYHVVNAKKMAASKITIIIRRYQTRRKTLDLSMIGASSLIVGEQNRFDVNRLTSEQCQKMFRFE